MHLTGLVVGGTSEARQVLRDLLQHIGASVLVARDATEALTFLRTRRVNLVIVDEGPGADGFDGCGLLELVKRRFPAATRALAGADFAPDTLINAINRAGVHCILRHGAPHPALLNELEGALNDALARKLDSSRALSTATPPSPRNASALATAGS